MDTTLRHYPVIVVGGGQAGLSMSWQLTQAGIGHAVLERHVPGHAWRDERWDTFCLVTPNWQCRLPGFDYAGNDPEGFMVRDDIVRYIEAYAASFDAPVRTGVTVTRLRQEKDGFVLETSDGSFAADQVVIATGGYHDAMIPGFATSVDPAIVQLHSQDYRNPQSLPDGAVLVVGTGQSGAQIAEDLHLAGRQVHLCVGDAPRVARRYRGRDVVEWLDRMGFYDLPVEKHPLGEAVREKTNHYVTGRDGGRDIDLRLRAKEGMRLYGRLEGADGTALRFGPDVAGKLDGADTVSADIKRSIDGFIAKTGLDAPAEAPYAPVWRPGPDVLALDAGAAGITAIVWCIGFAMNFSWVEPPVLDARGVPRHVRGVTPVDGLYVLGLPWLHSWGSGRFSGVARDSAHLLEQIVRIRDAAAAARHPRDAA